jgi:UDP-2,4-diacetamido-2,4,6-trideoxy-beta-L-altropyranose hydrolase
MIAKWAFRCDASHGIGCGHVMRLIALAEAALAQEIEIVWLVDQGAADIVRSRHKNNNMNEIVVEQTKETQIQQIIKQDQIDLVVFDGYHFQGEYIERLVNELDCFVAILDDNADLSWPKVDCIINGGFGAEELGYQRDDSAKYLITGPAYYLLRQEFNKTRASMLSQRPSNPSLVKQRCLVMFGGSDPLQLSDWFVSHAQYWPSDVYFSLLVGEKACLSDESVNALKHYDNLDLIYSSNNMAELIAQHDFVISAAGGALYECAFFEKATLAVIVAPNQNRTAHAISTELHWPQPINMLCNELLDGTGSKLMVELIQNFIEQETKKSIEPLCKHEDFPKEALGNKELGNKELRIVDGLGAQRVVKKLIEYSQKSQSETKQL